jgi:hypothetical protein
MYKEGTAMKHKISYTTVFLDTVKAIGICGALLMMFCAFCPDGMAEKQADPDKPLIVYYSRTGNCRLVVETLTTHVDADVLEIKDTKDRSGKLGFMSAGFDSYFDRDTVIDPSRPDLSTYSSIILVSPIWNWKLSVPIRTLLHQGGFRGKKVAVITTGNNPVDKYSRYGNDAPFLKRFFRDYIRGKKTSMQELVASQGAKLIAHHHVETKEKTAEEIKGATNSFSDALATELAMTQETPRPLISSIDNAFAR